MACHHAQGLSVYHGLRYPTVLRNFGGNVPVWSVSEPKSNPKKKSVSARILKKIQNKKSTKLKPKSLD